MVDTLDISLVSNVYVADIDLRDYPDFADAFIVQADYNGEPMTADQLTMLNADSSFVYECAVEQAFK